MYTIELNEIREKVRMHLPEKRFTHTLGVEKEAAKLAAIWNVDETAARAAALVHDYTKELSTGEHLKLCADWGIILQCGADKVPPVLHAFTGAEAASRIFGLDDEICRAVRCHTTGNADMSMLDKILYIADLTEENRNIACDQEVCAIRETSYKDIDCAVFMQLSGEIRRLVSKGKPIYIITVEAYNAFADQVKS